MQREGSRWAFRLAARALRPLKLAVWRELMCWPPELSWWLFAALHLAAGAGHGFLVPGNETLAEMGCAAVHAKRGPLGQDLEEHMAPWQPRTLHPSGRAHCFERKSGRKLTGWAPTTCQFPPMVSLNYLGLLSSILSDRGKPRGSGGEVLFHSRIPIYSPVGCVPHKALGQAEI